MVSCHIVLNAGCGGEPKSIGLRNCQGPQKALSADQEPTILSWSCLLYQSQTSYPVLLPLDIAHFRILSLKQSFQPELRVGITWGAFKHTAAWIPFPEILTERVWGKAELEYLLQASSYPTMAEARAETPPF